MCDMVGVQPTPRSMLFRVMFPFTISWCTVPVFLSSLCGVLFSTASWISLPGHDCCSWSLPVSFFLTHRDGKASIPFINCVSSGSLVHRPRAASQRVCNLSALRRVFCVSLFNAPSHPFYIRSFPLLKNHPNDGPAACP
jgi:hypothetical protein